MSYQSAEEQERSKVVLSDIFVGSNLVVESPAVPMTKMGEALLVFGAQPNVTTFLGNVFELLGKGDERYFWSGVRPVNNNQVIVAMLEKAPDKRVPRLELVLRLFILDLLRYTTLQIRKFGRLTILTPSGSIIHTSLVETPSLA